MRNFLFASLLILCYSLFTSCSPRVGIYQISNTDLQLNQDGILEHGDSIVRIGYELWGPGGAPWITLQNKSSSSLTLDLSESGASYLDQPLVFSQGSFSSIDGQGYRDRFPADKIIYVKGSPHLVLPPGEWVGFEIPPIAWSACRRKRSNETSPRMSHCLSINYIFQVAESTQHQVVHTLDAYRLEVIKRKEIEQYPIAQEVGNKYYNSNAPDQEYNSTRLILNGLEIVAGLIAILVLY